MKRFTKGIAIIMSCALMFTAVSGCAKSQSSSQEANNSNEQSTTKMVTDMRGEEVEIPSDPQRVAIIDKGFLVQTMSALGVQDKIIASGDLIQSATSANERDSLYLYPQLLDLPQIGYPTTAVDYETLVASNPDLVILRNSEYIKDSEITAEAIKKIESDLKIPLVVVNGPGCYDEVKIETQYEGIRLMGEVFGRQERAEEVISLMTKTIDLVKERTSVVSDDEKPSVMYIGGLKGEELTGSVWGSNYGDAKFGEEIANIKNVHNVHEAIRQVSAEQIVTMNPDSIILCTVSPTPEVFLSDALYAPLRNVTAVQNKNVASLGLLTWWGDFRLEVPTIMLISAKSVYPELFEDINVGEWLNEYHMSLYGLNEQQSQELKVAQQLDWMDKEGF